MPKAKLSIEALQLEYQQAAGAAIQQWAQFEGTLLFFFQEMAQIPDQFRARIIWATLPNLQARRKVLNRFAENYLEGDALRCFRILMNRMSKLGRKRNMIAHCPSGIHAETRKAFFLDFDRDGDDRTFLFLDSQSHDLNSVKGWAPAIKKLMEDFIDFLPTLQAQLQASSKMHRALQGSHATSR